MTSIVFSPGILVIFLTSILGSLMYLCTYVSVIFLTSILGFQVCEEDIE